MITPSAPSTNVCAAKRPLRIRSCGTAATIRNPAVASRNRFSGSGGSSPSGSSIWITIAADQSSSAAVTRKVTSIPKAATSRPPSAGPTNSPTLSIVLAVTFEAVSSSGVRARPGTSAAWAGRNALETTVPTTESP